MKNIEGHTTRTAQVSAVAFHHALRCGGCVVVEGDHPLARRLAGVGGGRGGVLCWFGLGGCGPARSLGGDDAWLLFGPGVWHAVSSFAIFVCAAAAWPDAQVVREGSAPDAKMAARRRVVLEDSPSARLPRPDALKVETSLNGWSLTGGALRR